MAEDAAEGVAVVVEDVGEVVVVVVAHEHEESWGGRERLVAWRTKGFGMLNGCESI